MPSYKAREGVTLDRAEIAKLVAPLGAKFAWFLEQEYIPHYWQTLFHTMRHDDSLCRFRHLVAGRRGGKTLSAAWEMLYYALHPQQFHRDAHGEESDRPLHIWVLTRDYPAGLPALITFREALKQAGCEHGKEYKENRGNRWFEFDNGTFLQFKTADEPDSLRGAGLDLLWMDEAAFIPDNRAWNVVSPALADKLGLVITTTTPSGKNWFYDEFWNEEALKDPEIGRVEYWSIDNPHFAQSEWRRYKRTFHPLLFKQEFCAAFDSMAGKELSGDWLHYYKTEELPKELDYFIGVDPAISLSDDADRFSLAVLGMTKDRAQSYLIDQYAGRIPFPEQLIKIQEFHQQYRPQIIGVESNAYQAVLAQQALRLPGFLPIMAMLSKGKKSERILGMSPLFRIGRVKIRTDHRDFINEWLDYDSTLKNPKDDCLDAVEIALRAAGALLPIDVEPEFEPVFAPEDEPPLTLQDLAWQWGKSSQRDRNRSRSWDEFLGEDW